MSDKNLPKAIMCWSGGKDSAFCLHKVLTEKLFDVKYLLTTINEYFHRISMHGVREELLDRQAQALNLPLLKVGVSDGTNKEYEQNMEKVLLQTKTEGITHVIFGDIFLEDLRRYREKNLAKIGMTAVFPIWKMDTTALINDFIKQKFKTVVVCTNDGYLGKDWVGRDIDLDFLRELPANVDPCGENGEYHTFCYDGPLYTRKINFTLGEKVYRPLETKTGQACGLPSKVQTKGFWFCDFIPLEVLDEQPR